MLTRPTWLLVCALSACSPAGSTPEPAAAPILAPPGSPLSGLTPAPRETASWRGTVEERLAAGGYSYLAVREGEALRWVAVMGPGEPAGATVVVHAYGTRKDFHSPRLDRDFDELVFASVEHDPSTTHPPGT